MWILLSTVEKCSLKLVYVGKQDAFRLSWPTYNNTQHQSPFVHSRGDASNLTSTWRVMGALSMLKK
jgi:hypothetical protein